MSPSPEQLLETHAGLPEAYQPAWGLPESTARSQRQCEDRFAIVRDAVMALPADRPLRILDVGCAQGYFSLGLKSELQRHGRQAEVLGVDYLEDNVRFCRALAEFHGLDVRFMHDRFDAGFFERHGLADFDVVLALNVVHHIRELDGAAAADETLSAIRAHSTVLLCEIAQPQEALDWIADWHSSDDAMLRGFAFRRRLGTFATHLTEVKRPLYGCSNRLAYVGGRWFDFDRVLDRAHPGVPDRFAGQRRFFIGPHSIVKACRTTGDFGAFNRAELEQEAQVLEALRDEPSRYPPLLAQADDGNESWLARGIVPGVLVSELIEKGASFDRAAMVRALLDELAHLQGCGFYHADLRAWNMLWDGNTLRLIDFGSMQRQDSPLHRAALAAVLAEIARGKLSHAQPWYAAVHPLSSYPPEWHGMVRYLAGCPQAGFSFAEARIRLDEVHDQTDSGGLTVCAELLAACADAQVEGFARSRAHVDDLELSLSRARLHAESLERDLRRVTSDAVGEREAFLQKMADANRYASSLEEQIARETAAARAEREAAQAALAEATAYAKSLEEERARLKEQAGQLERMRRRFRLLRPFWPRDN
ncbi:MAG TPA: class I SAM-dependent methyltransferase [Rhodanobacteraceae bacterium]|nr:class I SAM-dependent methyltransferase [Rhodanobacteraceae bacterium]